MRLLISLSLYVFITAQFLTGCDTAANNNYYLPDGNHIAHYTTGEMKINDLYAEAKQMLPVITNITGEHYNSIKDILADASYFDKADVYATESDDDIADSTRELLEQLKTLVISKQVKAFPMMRKAFIDSIKEALGKKGVIVSGSGQIIKFAAAPNISDTIVDSLHWQIQSQLSLLRFEYCTYKLNYYDDKLPYPNYIKKDDDIDYTDRYHFKRIEE
jgi:hypothetical protein